MYVVKTYVTEKIGKFTGAEAIAACPMHNKFILSVVKTP